MADIFNYKLEDNAYEVTSLGHFLKFLLVLVRM